MSEKCLICGNSDSSFNWDGDRDGYVVKCNCCGTYKISGTLAPINIIQNSANKYILSALIRESNELNQQIELTTTNIGNYLSKSKLPITISGKLDKILLYIFNHTHVAGRTCRIDIALDYPVAYAVDQDEFLYLLNILYNNGLIEPEVVDSPIESIDNLRLTLDGWERVENLKRSQIISGNQCFIAMSFDYDLKEVYINGIKSAIEETGYKPVRIDLIEHNEYIPDKIIAEIRQSRLMVADFTGQKAGVYFEAGFAMGLNIPVIWTCRKDEIDKCHFDTKQLSHIVWNTTEELKERLKNRILAIAPLK